ncbi:MAG: asparagine synthase (glutamine-hydrolyzing) [Pseudomonadota bacterium]
MCGISGIFLTSHHADPRRLSSIEQMTTSLHHRGPDGAGIWVDRDAGIALGHRRLAIIDLSEEGFQPMHSHGDNLVLTYNGEVYNHTEIRRELEACGDRFRGHSDTEVMLAAFNRFGVEAALNKLVGMFALGLWDKKKRVLHLARDRIGKKPLYVGVVKGGIAFASELKGLLAYPEIRTQVDPQALAMVLLQGWIPDNHCIWRGVFKLPPGAMLSISADDLVFTNADRLRQRTHRWWSLRRTAEEGQRQPYRQSLPELETELDDLLRMVVSQRMVADVPVGAFLSGGIDSSTLVALMQAQSSRPVRTFSIGFAGTHYDEAPQAALVAKHLGTEHTEFNVTSEEARSVIPDLPGVWDEPFADESQIPTLLLSRLARRDVTVALTGDGGDECFGGYNRHVMQSRLAPVFRLPKPVRAGMTSGLNALSSGFWDQLLSRMPLPSTLGHSLRSENLQKLADVLDVANEQEFYDRLTRFGPISMMRDPPAAPAGHIPALPDATSRLIYRDMAEYLPGDILVKTDRASMAASLEARCPLLDHRLIEFAWRLPTSAKVRDGKGKWLLRRVLNRYLPGALFDRPKHGFNVPVGDWLRGPLREWAHDLLHSRRMQTDGFLDSDRVRQCWDQHLSGRRDRGRELWAILMVQAWLDSSRDRIAPHAAATHFMDNLDQTGSSTFNIR